MLNIITYHTNIDKEIIELFTFYSIDVTLNSLIVVLNRSSHKAYHLAAFFLLFLIRNDSEPPF